MQEEQKQPLQQNPQCPPAEQKPAEEEVNPEDPIDRTETIDKVYDVEGLLGGGAAGIVIGLIISFDVIFAMQIGMFIGLIIGTRFKKDKNKIDKDGDKKDGTPGNQNPVSGMKNGNNDTIKY